MEASIPMNNWMAVVGFIIEKSGKIKTRNIFVKFEEEFTEDFTKEDLHMMLDYLIEKKNMRIDEITHMVTWIGNDKEEKE